MLTFTAAFISAALFAVPPSPEIRDFSWLTGCWAAEGGDRGSGEMWSTAEGKTLLGVSRTVVSGDTVAFEYMRIAHDSNGKIVFTALPSGQKETSFTLVSHHSRRLVFENLTHDFPQRVIYERLGDELTGTIEGTTAGKRKQVVFRFIKQSCP